MAATPTLRAAGAVLWRTSDDGNVMAVVHRPRYDDWSLPKGKVHDGETDLAAAVREVREETGARAVVTRRLGTTRYEVDGRRKRVAFWAMRFDSGDFAPSGEVDRLDWLTTGEARDRLTYDSDRAIVEAFAQLPAPESTIVLVRHARAGKRSEWNGPDDERPLDGNGRRQAERLVGFLACFGPDRVLSADRVRCVDTVRPFAEAAGLPLEVDPVFSDESYLASPSSSLTALLSLAKPGQCAVVCSQGLTIPSVIDRLAPGIVDSSTRKGAAWVLSFVDGEVVAADRYDEPGAVTD